MYIPLRNVSDAANSANSEHRTFAQFMAGEVDVRVIVNSYLYAKMGTNSRELRAKFARICPSFAFASVAADTGERHNTNRALNGYHGQAAYGKGVAFSRTDLFFIFFRIFETISSIPTNSKRPLSDKIVVLGTHIRSLIQKFP